MPPEDRAQVRGHRGDRDDLDRLADLEAAGGGVERDRSGYERGQRPRADHPEQRAGGGSWVKYFRATSETPEERAGGRGEEQPFDTRSKVAAGGDPHQHGADREDRALDRDQRRKRGGSRGGLAPAPVSPITGQPRRRDRDADPLAPSEAKAEEALRETRPGTRAHPTGPPARSRAVRARAHRGGGPTPRSRRSSRPGNHLERNRPTALRSGWRAVIGGREHRPALLEQEGEVRGRRRGHRQHQPEDHRRLRRTRSATRTTRSPRSSTRP